MEIIIERIFKKYGDQVVLDLANLKIESGKITAILGPNGSGKSTLLNLIADLIPAEKKIIKYDGLLTFPSSELTLMFQAPYLIDGTVFQNIAYPLKLRKVKKEEQKRLVEAIASRLEISHLLAKNSRSLSLGEAQRVALARVLVFEPKVLLLDEPTASIDERTSKLISEILLSLKNTSIIIVTHNLFEAKKMADYVLMLNHGKLVEYTESKIFFENPKELVSKKFIRGDYIND